MKNTIIFRRYGQAHFTIKLLPCIWGRTPSHKWMNLQLRAGSGILVDEFAIKGWVRES